MTDNKKMRRLPVFSSSFFSSKVGHAALVSVAAMIAFTVFSQLQHDVASAQVLLTSTPTMELA